MNKDSRCALLVAELVSSTAVFLASVYGNDIDQMPAQGAQLWLAVLIVEVLKVANPDL